MNNEIVKGTTMRNANESDKNRLVVLLLCIFLGCLGVHRFYVGKFKTGLLMTLTGGVFGVLTIIDIVMICLGSFTDNEGDLVTKWD